VVFPGMGHDLPQQLWPQLVREIVTHAMSVQPGGATRAWRPADVRCQSVNRRADPRRSQMASSLPAFSGKDQYHWPSTSCVSRSSTPSSMNRLPRPLLATSHQRHRGREKNCEPPTITPLNRSTRQLEGVVGTHLARFGERDELTVRWELDPAASTPP